jgi:uncharacterized protein YPO0396
MKTSSHEELENHNVVMFPSSKNFKTDLSKMEASQDPLYNILNEYSDLSEDDLPDYNDDRFELDFEDELEGDSYHSLEAFMGRNSEEETHSPDDMLIKIINDRIKDINDAKERIKFYLGEIEMFLPSRKK